MLGFVNVRYFNISRHLLTNFNISQQSRCVDIISRIAEKCRNIELLRIVENAEKCREMLGSSPGQRDLQKVPPLSPKLADKGLENRPEFLR